MLRGKGGGEGRKVVEEEGKVQEVGRVQEERKGWGEQEDLRRASSHSSRGS